MFPSLCVDFFSCGVGAAAGESDVVIPKSLRVRIKRLDDIWSDPKHMRPVGMNIDVEGFELEILDRFGGLAFDSESIIIESHIERVLKKENRFGDLIITMKEMGFELADTLNALGQQPVAYDCLFLQISL